jgi:hypothetical protein
MRFLIRAILLLLLIAFVGALALGIWPAGLPRWNAGGEPRGPGVGTSGNIDTERVRERAADLGEKAAVATQQVKETLDEAALTTKIKAKMTLDDSLDGSSINVTTSGSTVTVAGRVPSPAARDRALTLARETTGVSVVVDHLEVAP